MIKTISIAAYNRPDNLAWLLQTLKEQLLPLDDYQLHICIDRGKHFDAVREVAEGVDFIETHVTWPKGRLGMNRGTFESIRRPFEEVGADFNVYLEEDFLLSPDAFNLVEWYINHEDEVRSHPKVKDVATYCLCSLAMGGGTSPTEVVLRRGGGLWGFVLSRRQWNTYVKGGWLAKRRREAGKRIYQVWDKQLAAHIRTFLGVYRAFPALSRTSNSGKTQISCEYVYDEELGVHKCLHYNQERKAYTFNFTGVKD